jgi:alkylmercury lyase
VTAATTLKEQIRKFAFRHLLRSQHPVSVVTLADQLGQSAKRIEAQVRELDRQGLVRLNQRGDVIGSVGLSVEPSRHELFIGDRKFWTWCAYDSVGILAALGASGRVLSKSPLTGIPITLAFRDGSPEKSDAVLFLPDSIGSASGSIPSPAPGVSVFDDWCPVANLFENREASHAWLERHHVPGETLSLTEAAARGAANWQRIVEPVRVVSIGGASSWLRPPTSSSLAWAWRRGGGRTTGGSWCV